MSQFSDQFFALVEKAENILITAHLSPDEDAIASLLAVYYLLSNKYQDKKVTPLLSSERLDQYQSFAGYSDIKFVSDLSEHLSGQDLIILLDGSEYHRFTQKPDSIESFTGQTITIDHHKNQPDDFDLLLLEPTASSTTELIYCHFFHDQDINSQIAQLLLMGILGDTGNFAYLSPDQADVLSIAQKLLAASGTQIQSLQARYRSISPSVFKLLKILINHTDHHQIADWPPLQTSFLTRKDAQNCSTAQISEASHLYMNHYLRHLTGYPWGVVFTPESDGSVKISLRSLPETTNVRRIVERQNIGGGHDLAAGGGYHPSSNQSLSVKKIKQDFLSWLQDNSPSSE